jgi:hypothetical protein
MDTDKIKDLFVYNFEKMILVVVIGVAVFLIYSGSQQPVFTADNDPDDLKTKANNVKREIDLDHNAVVIDGEGLADRTSRRPIFDIVAATDRSATRVNDGDYRPTKKWVAGTQSGKKIRRRDPRLAPPESLVVTAVASVIAIQADDPDLNYPLMGLDAADPIEKKEKKSRRKKRSRSRGGDGGEEDGMEEDMEGMLGDMSGPGVGMGDALGGMGEGAGADGPTRKFDKKNDFGYRPMGEEGDKPIPTFGRFIVGTAVVPYKKMYDQYAMCLSDSQGYTPGRDTPMFCDMQIRRADVTDKTAEEIKNLKEEDWVQLRWDRKLLTMLAAQKWSGFAPEIVPDDYRDDALSLWLPPVMLDDYRSYASHPLIPKLSRTDLEKEEAAKNNDDDNGNITFDINGDEDFDLAPAGSRSSGGGSSMGSMGAMGDMGEMMGDMEDMGGGMGMGMGMAMMGRGFDKNPSEYKLVRFFDFYSKEMYGFEFPDGKVNAKLGRRYVYSIRYAVDDPNFPRFPSIQPQLNTLESDVAKRVDGLMSKVLTLEDRVERSKRWSEWSAPSEPVGLPSLQEYYAGPVEAGSASLWQVDGKEVQYQRDAPKVTVAISNFDPEIDAKVSVRAEKLFEGALLSAKADHADVVDPITLEVKKTPPVEYESGTIIVDIDGGLPLDITDDLNEPGMILLFGGDNSLQLSDDVSDMEMYRINTYADERGE